MFLCAQIVDMELPDGQTILGARLVEITGGSSSGGSAATTAALLLLTQSQLICYHLQQPA
jgi:hypothetical protein